MEVSPVTGSTTGGVPEATNAISSSSATTSKEGKSEGREVAGWSEEASTVAAPSCS